MSERNFFLGTLSAEQSSNWLICKNRGLWGSGSSPHAKHAAKHVRAGDLMFVWLSRKGLFALAEFIGPAVTVAPGVDVPWPSPEKYLNVYPIRPLVELAEPLGDSFEDHRSIRFGVRTHELQSGLIKIEPDLAAVMAEAIGLPIGGSSEALAEVGGSASGDQESIDLAQPDGAIYLRPADPVVSAMLELWRAATSAPDNTGQLLVVGDETQRDEYQRELSREPFLAMASRFAFVTPEQLAADLRARLAR